MIHKNNPFYRDYQKLVHFDMSKQGKTDFSVTIPITCQKAFKPEDRFGTNSYQQVKFIKDFLSLEIDGYKVCDTLNFRWESGSPHAENFLWNVINYRVSFDISLTNQQQKDSYHYDNELCSGTKVLRTPSGGF